jgi:hypothetical protein
VYTKIELVLDWLKYRKNSYYKQRTNNKTRDLRENMRTPSRLLLATALFPHYVTLSACVLCVLSHLYATQHLPFLRYVLKIVWKFDIGICMEVGFVIYVGVFGVGWRERDFEHCVRWLCAMAMRCAERSGTCTMLWQHDFYMVNEPRHAAWCILVTCVKRLSLR